MLAKLHTISLVGIDALPVEVEVDVSPGALPKTVLVGLPEQAVKESTHRIERAMVNSGFVWPQLLECPILKFQTRHLGEVVFISRKQCRVERNYNRPDLQVHSSDANARTAKLLVNARQRFSWKSSTGICR